MFIIVVITFRNSGLIGSRALILFRSFQYLSKFYTSIYDDNESNTSRFRYSTILPLLVIALVTSTERALYSTTVRSKLW